MTGTNFIYFLIILVLGTSLYFSLLENYKSNKEKNHFKKMYQAEKKMHGFTIDLLKKSSALFKMFHQNPNNL